MMDFNGDLLLIDTPDGGDIEIIDGVFSGDPGIATAVYISLFGGNKDDAGKIKTNRTWWGNTLEGTAEAEFIVSRFQHIITALPLTVKNMQAAESAALLDLQWIKDQGVADTILAEGKAGERGKFILTINILKNGDSIFESGFQTSWAAKAA